MNNRRLNLVPVHSLARRRVEGGFVHFTGRTYNGLGQLTAEKQEHNGAATTGSLKVQYAYSEMASGANHSRPTSMTYPDGRVLSYAYDTGLDNTISRLSKLTWAGTDVESYSYLGLGTVVVRDRPQANHTLTYAKQSGENNGDAGDQYTGLDRFGRITDQRWTLDVGGHADRFTYGYDRNGNRLYEENLLDATKSELYHDGTGYDPLDRLGYFARGTLDAEKDGLTGSATRSQDWTLDALGNWSSVVNDGTTQTRTHDGQNRITAVSGATSPLHSANGEMTRDETGQLLAYDAWGRLVSVNTDGTGSAEVTYAYDAAYRRIKRNSNDLYYSDQWQVLEERDAQGVEGQYVWSPVYVDAMVLRDRDSDNDGVMETTDERLYVVHDANFNVTALTNAAGTVQERFIYDAYGTRTVLDANWANDADGTSDFGFEFGHQGGRHDLTTGLVHFRNRDLDTSLGRWTRQDPFGFVDGSNLHAYIGNSPASKLDPEGHMLLSPIGLTRDQPSTGPTTGPTTTPGQSFLPEGCACDFFDEVEPGQLPGPPFRPSAPCDANHIGARSWTLRMNGVCYYPFEEPVPDFVNACNVTGCDGGCALLQLWACVEGTPNPKMPFLTPVPTWREVVSYEFGCGLAVNV